VRGEAEVRYLGVRKKCREGSGRETTINQFTSPVLRKVHVREKEFSDESTHSELYDKKTEGGNISHGRDFLSRHRMQEKRGGKSTRGKMRGGEGGFSLRCHPRQDRNGENPKGVKKNDSTLPILTRPNYRGRLLPT